MSYALPPLPTRPTEWRPDLVNYPCFIQQKLNGIRCLLAPDGRAWSKTAKILPGLKGYFTGSDLWLDGEIVDSQLINKPIEQKPSDVLTLQSINSIVSSNDPITEELNKLSLIVFDVIVPKMIQSDRLLLLSDLALPFNIHVIHTAIVKSPDKAKLAYESMSPEHEGMIYRDVSALYEHGNTTSVLKRKRWINAEYVCLSIHEGMGKFLGMFGGAVLALPDGKKFKCGGGNLTVADRKNLWANPPIGKLITVRFPYYSDDQVPLQAQIESVRNYE